MARARITPTGCCRPPDNCGGQSRRGQRHHLQQINQLPGRETFRRKLCSLDGAPVIASNGVPFSARPFDQALEDCHAPLVCGGLRVDPRNERRHLAAPSRAAHRGHAVAALSTASYRPARAGLLDDYRCTIRRESRAGFKRAFPCLPSPTRPMTSAATG